MRRLLLLIVLACSLGIIGCGERTTASPTPFPTSGPTTTPPVTGPVVLSVTDLMSAPGLYLDAEVQLTGLLRKQPLIVCDSDFHPSPAGWGLAEEGVLALAGGFEQQIRSLLPDDLAMTVEGRWRRWEGTVGCGKQAQRQEVWYLDVSRILSPSPITQVTLTPASGIEIAAITDTPAPELQQTTDPFPVETPLFEETPSIPETTEEPETVASPTVDPFDDNQTTVVPTLAATTGIGVVPGTTPGANLTVTPTSTIDPLASGTPTATLDPSQPTPTSTATSPASGQVVSKGDLFDVMEADFLVSNLAGGTIDSWTLDVFEDESLFVYVIAPPSADIILSLLVGGQPIINRQNTAPPGSPEVINNPALQGEDQYEIQVMTNGGVSTDYALLLYTDPDSPVTIAGFLTSGTPRSSVQMPAGAYQYWFFMGNAGDQLTALLTPLGQEDPALYLFDSTGQEITGVDDGFEGEEEIIEETLETSGMFALMVEEFNGDLLNYNIQITLE